MSLEASRGTRWRGGLDYYYFYFKIRIFSFDGGVFFFYNLFLKVTATLEIMINLPGSIKSFKEYENHIGAEVDEILRYTHKHTQKDR